jgi:hypothetical protein
VLIDPPVPAPLLRRCSQRGLRIWLIDASVAPREHHRTGPGSAYDSLSRCPPLGIVRKNNQPVRWLELDALEHA